MATATIGSGLHTLPQWLAALRALPSASTAVSTPIRGSSDRSFGKSSCTASSDDNDRFDLWTVLCNRYGRSDKSLLSDRIAAYTTAVENAMAPGAGFSVDVPVAIVASPGRDRLFMGHTDMIGLGGFTVDAATAEELIAIAQRTEDGTITLSNARNDLYPLTSFKVEEREQVVMIWERIMVPKYGIQLIGVHM